MQKFEQETGFKAKVTYYASNGELISKLKATRATGFDLAQPSVTLIPAAMDFNLYRPIEPERIANFKNLIPSMVKASEELGGIVKGKRYGLPFDWGTEGISYNTKKIARRPTSFGAIHQDEFAGRVTYRATFHVFVSTGLWIPIKFVAPREGAMTWMDGFAIPRGAKNLDAAYAWMNFMYDPRNAALFTKESGYFTAVEGAAAHLEPGIKKQYEESFSPEDIKNLWWYGIEHTWWLDMFAKYVDRLKAA